jgi:hypothetical protein
MPRIPAKTPKYAGSSTAAAPFTGRAAVTATALMLALACLSLVACGGSAGDTASKTGAAPSSAARSRAALASRFKALRTCLQKNGVVLPDTLSKDGAGGLLGGVGAPPAGVSRSGYEAALKKCGAARAGRSGNTSRSGSPAFKQQIAKFTACLRENGVILPAPNTSGEGPIFNTSGVDTTSAKFKAAQAKCASLVRGLLPSRPPSG